MVFPIQNYKKKPFQQRTGYLWPFAVRHVVEKTELVFRMLHENTFSRNFLAFFYFYQHEKPKFKSLEAYKQN